MQYVHRGAYCLARIGREFRSGHHSMHHAFRMVRRRLPEITLHDGLRLREA